MSTIFISHRKTDSAEADELKAWLAHEGHTQLFLDFDPMHGIPAGVDWEQRLYRELRRCQALLVVLTPAWLESKWCSNELAIAREKGKAVFVVRVKPCVGAPIIPSVQEVDLMTDRASALERLARGLKEHGIDPADAFTWNPNRPIYPGLGSFAVEDAAIFFGRETESIAAVEAIRRLRLQPPGSPKLLLITGASGSGKSSLMRAGLLARLRNEPANWITTNPFRRGHDALLELVRVLAFAYPIDRRPSSLETLAGSLRGKDAHRQLIGIASKLQLAWNRPGATLVLALDQAEELLAPDAGPDAVGLLDLLREALVRSAQDLLVVATIRSDRLGTWQQHGSVKADAERAELAFETFPLGPMPMDRLGNIVRKPAEREGLVIDDDLVDALKKDTGTSDALPLLAYTLRHLHDLHGADQRLTLAEYKSIGRLEGSVETQAKATIDVDRLDPRTLEALRDAFVPGLVQATEDGNVGSFVKGPARFAALPAPAQPLIRRLGDEARLLVFDRDQEGQETVEIAHEALLRVWPQLERWIQADAGKLRRLAAIQRAASEWKSSGENGDFLIHRRDRLREAEELAALPRFGTKLDATPTARSYLAACRKAQSESDELERRDIRRRQVRTALVVGLGAVLLGVLGTVGVGVFRRESIRAALVRELASSSEWIGISPPENGQFMMGCLPHDTQCTQPEGAPDESKERRPPTKLSRRFDMMRHEVTVKQYRRFVEAESTIAGWLLGTQGIVWEQQSGDDHPVVKVTWQEARDFCGFVRGGLPTEAEWEHAARGGKVDTIYPWGNDFSPDQANGKGVEGKDKWQETAPVGSFPPNGYGLHDMIGNVWEWTLSLYRENPFDGGDGSAELDLTSDKVRVVRGGSRFDDKEVLRVSYRVDASPGSRSPYIGFRCARHRSP